MKLEIEIPAKLKPLAAELRGNRYRHIILKGGRGSGKSWGIARVLSAYSYAQPLRVLCTRETQKSIKESSHRLIADQLQTLGLSRAFDVQEKVIRGGAGSEFSFVGLKEHTADSIKSYEGYDIAWIEEAHAVSDKSANVLIPTLRKPGSKLIWSFNPDQEDDFVYRLANSGRADVLVIEINWSDNKFFPAELEAERQALRAINDDLYRHVWEGECRSAAGLLFKRPWFKFYDVLPAKLNKYISSDYAGGLDPDNPNSDPDDTCHGVWGVTTDGDLYLVDGWAGQDDTAEAIGQWLGLVSKHKPMRAFDEKGPILRAIDPFIRRAMRTKRIFVCRESLASAGSKSDRALGFAALASAGCVYLPNTAFGQKVLNQLCAFNGQDGRPDDCVDMCSLMARGLDFMANAGKMAEDKRKMPDDYGINDDETDSWKVA
jgi:phage terminase large subunit-like protein